MVARGNMTSLDDDPPLTRSAHPADDAVDADDVEMTSLLPVTESTVAVVTVRRVEALLWSGSTG